MTAQERSSRHYPAEHTKPRTKQSVESGIAVRLQEARVVLAEACHQAEGASEETRARVCEQLGRLSEEFDRVKLRADALDSQISESWEIASHSVEQALDGLETGLLAASQSLQA